MLCFQHDEQSHLRQNHWFNDNKITTEKKQKRKSDAKDGKNCILNKLNSGNSNCDHVMLVDEVLGCGNGRLPSDKLSA